MNADTIDRRVAEPLRRLTVRLPDADFEELRDAAFKARRRPAEVARAMIMAALSGEAPAKPRPAPPSPVELNSEAQRLLAACKASISNLLQIAGHAHELGYPQAPALSIEFDHMASVLRALGLDLKSGQRVPVGAAQIELAADQVNTLARSLNQDARSVPPQSWTPPLAALRAALAGLPK